MRSQRVQTLSASRATAQNEFRQFRAPQGNGQVCIEPGFDQAPQTLKDNVQCLQSHGEPFVSIRTAARKELVTAAIKYTSAYREVDWASNLQDAPIIMAGHQPAIFHPGVWFKNFALSHIAQQTGAIAINMVVDNDVATSSGIRVPTLDLATGVGAYRLVPYDNAGAGIPYEQTTIQDLEQFDRFDKEVAEAIRPLIADPCVTRLWQHARDAIARCGVAGCAIAQARHGFEGALGLQTLEIPLGVICRTTAFAEFILSILDELPRFQSCYNTAANQYRSAHGIRSTAHPVPDLAEQDGWFEAPLWIYGDDSPQRRPAWVRCDGDEIVISDRAGRELSIDTRFPKLAAEQLASHASPHFKLRPRALLTTMYARLVLSDLFLHGIGGGKYDQLGDLITRQFFAVEPPQFMVISATIQLPGFRTDATPNAGLAQLRQLKRAIRDTHYQGERFATQADMNPEDVDQKQRLLATIPPRGGRAEWQRQIEGVNQRLSTQLSQVRFDLQLQLEDVQRDLSTAALLSSREHPFCLFPIEYLTETYRSLLR
jgi:hypothetical protein